MQEECSTHPTAENLQLLLELYNIFPNTTEALWGCQTETKASFLSGDVNSWQSLQKLERVSLAHWTNI